MIPPQHNSLILGIGRRRVVTGAEPPAELIDVDLIHRTPMLPQHFGKIFGKDVDLLLQKKERRSDRTQLSLVDDKGEFFHLFLMALNIPLSGYCNIRQKEGVSHKRLHRMSASMQMLEGRERKNCKRGIQ